MFKENYVRLREQGDQEAVKKFQKEAYKKALKETPAESLHYNHSFYYADIIKTSVEQYVSKARMTYILVNQHKYHFCKASYLQFQQFDFSAFKNKIFAVRQKMRNFQQYRANLYCNMCDANY